MRPSAGTLWTYQQGGNRAVWFLLTGNGNQLDDRVSVLQQLFQESCGVVTVGRIPREQLARRQHDLFGRLATATAPAHAIGDNAEHATRCPGMTDDQDLVLLIGAIALVEARGNGESEAFNHWRPALEAPN